jgi:hypothetical protein
MAYLRLHKRISLIPGLRLNLAKTGPSLGLGTNGAMLNIGPAGVRTTVGLPGSGVSVISRQTWAGTSPAAPAPAATARATRQPRRRGSPLLTLGGLFFLALGFVQGSVLVIALGAILSVAACALSWRAMAAS